MNQTCALPICKAEATKKVIWADGRAYQPSCEDHVRDVQKMLKAKNGTATELAGVQDLSDVMDLASAAYPDLERKPGGPDNWVEKTGGLPTYIERIAKNLHYERGYSISRAIATAVNTVKRWAKGGTVTKHGTTKTVSPATIAKSIKAVAEWMAKRAAAKTDLTDELLFVIDLSDVSDELAFDLLDLADAAIEHTDTMVALMLPRDITSKLAVEGGVPESDLHITVGFYGECEDEEFEDLKEDVAEFAKNWQGGPLKGKIGGIDSFPAKDPEKGQPYWVPVDIEGLDTLYTQLAEVTDGMRQDYGKYTPHVTLAYVKDGEAPPKAVEDVDVEFESLWVVRGNTERVEFRLGTGTGADLTDHAILSAGDIDLTRGLMDIQALADRANAVADPVVRGEARARVLDLASTIAPRKPSGKVSDGRRSYKRQGRWGHGFVPLDRAAHEAKAKGSPIAIKRTTRLFGSRNKGFRKQDAVAGKTRIQERGTSESAGDIAQLRRAKFQDTKETKHSRGRKVREASKGGGGTARALQDWDSIPEELKTIRNGKKYVVATFGGKQIITEHIGGVDEVAPTALRNRKVMTSITAADAANMSTAELRAMLKNPRTPKSIRKALNKALNAKIKEAQSRG